MKQESVVGTTTGVGLAPHRPTSRGRERGCDWADESTCTTVTILQTQFKDRLERAFKFWEPCMCPAVVCSIDWVDTASCHEWVKLENSRTSRGEHLWN